MDRRVSHMPHHLRRRPHLRACEWRRTLLHQSPVSSKTALEQAFRILPQLSLHGRCGSGNNSFYPSKAQIGSLHGQIAPRAIIFSATTHHHALDLVVDCSIYERDSIPEIQTGPKHFYDLTNRISGSLHVTIDSFFSEIGEVHILIKNWMNSDDILQAEMGKRMKDKYNKYWGAWHENVENERRTGRGKEKEKENMNLLIFVGAALDPRYKLSEYTKLAMEEMFGEETGGKVWTAVQACVRDLYDEYRTIYAPTDAAAQVSNSQEPKGIQGGMMKTLIANRLRLSSTASGNIKSELEKYLAEDTEDINKKVDILAWWKVNSSRFPILAHLARDVLAIPISMVASELTFSTSGRILDDFRTSLTAFTLQALVCTQDWQRRAAPIDIQENMEELAELEKELIDEYNDQGKSKRKMDEFVSISRSKASKSSKSS